MRKFLSYLCHVNITNMSFEVVTLNDHIKTRGSEVILAARLCPGVMQR
jgi:hypothetical protein